MAELVDKIVCTVKIVLSIFWRRLAAVARRHDLHGFLVHCSTIYLDVARRFELPTAWTIQLFVAESHLITSAKNKKSLLFNELNKLTSLRCTNS